MLGINREERAMMEAERRQQDFHIGHSNFNHAIDSASEYTAIQQQDNKSDLLKWQQDVNEELFNLCQSLRAMYLKDNQWVPIPNKPPLCNDLFIHDVVKTQLEPFFSRVRPNTNLSEKTALAELRATADTIACAMADGYDQYDIMFKDYDVILQNLKNTMRACAFRPVNGWTKKLDNTITKRVEAHSEINREHERRRGLFNFNN